MPETHTVKGFSEDGLPFAEGDFESLRTLQPLGYISVYFRLFLTRKIFWREKQERKHKSIRFEILKTGN